MAQILHLGFWKTGTTGLQRLVFQAGHLAYFGVKDGRGPSASRTWIEHLRQGSLPGEWHRRDFVFSYECALIRLGGWAGLTTAALRIAELFANPHVLLTVREPASMLLSTYRQSLSVRRLATGDLDGNRSYRLLAFDQWWRLLLAREQSSLAGLLDFGTVADVFIHHLGKERVTILPLESLWFDPRAYRASLGRLGLDMAAIDAFMRHPPLNATKDRLLRNPPLLCGRLGLMPKVLDHPWFDWLHRHSWPINERARYAETLAEIGRRYPYEPKPFSVPSACEMHTDP